jgi:hypothetical protein
MSCHVTRSGSTLEVSAEMSWTDTNEEACSTICVMPSATCETETLPDGDYEIHYAGKTLAISIPSSKFHFCAAGNAWHPLCCDSDADCPGTTCNSHMCNGR